MAEITINYEQARQEIEERGWTIIPDEPVGRTQATVGITGQYVSYYDPELKALLVVLHSRLRELLGI